MRTVDARGLDCPMPLVMVTDPEAVIDLAAWAADEGHTVAERAAEGWSEFVLCPSDSP